LAVAFDCNFGANAEISWDEAAAGVVRENAAALEKAGRASGSFGSALTFKTQMLQEKVEPNAL
jgi:hypothetical protein